MVQLIVADGPLLSAPDTVTVVTLAELPPVANAGPDQAVAVGATATLDGSGSVDPNGDPLTFAWVLSSRPSGSSAVLSDDAAVRPTLHADLPGDYEIDLVVNDGAADSLPDSVTVSTAGARPLADAGPDQTAGIGAPVMLDGTGSSDPGGDPSCAVLDAPSVRERSCRPLTDSLRLRVGPWVHYTTCVFASRPACHRQPIDASIGGPIDHGKTLGVAQTRLVGPAAELAAVAVADRPACCACDGSCAGGWRNGSATRRWRRCSRHRFGRFGPLTRHVCRPRSADSD